MRNAFVLAAALALLSAPALAQGGSPYNSSGSQAGGPLAGQERAMGARGGTPGMAPGAAPGMAAERSFRHRNAERMDLAAPGPRPEREQHRNVTMIPREGGRVTVRAVR